MRIKIRGDRKKEVSKIKKRGWGGHFITKAVIVQMLKLQIS